MRKRNPSRSSGGPKKSSGRRSSSSGSERPQRSGKFSNSKRSFGEDKPRTSRYSKRDDKGESRSSGFGGKRSYGEDKPRTSRYTKRDDKGESRSSGFGGKRSYGEDKPRTSRYTKRDDKGESRTGGFGGKRSYGEDKPRTSRYPKRDDKGESRTGGFGSKRSYGEDKPRTSRYTKRDDKGESRTGGFGGKRSYGADKPRTSRYTNRDDKGESRTGGFGGKRSYGEEKPRTSRYTKRDDKDESRAGRPGRKSFDEKDERTSAAGDKRVERQDADGGKREYTRRTRISGGRRSRDTEHDEKLQSGTAQIRLNKYIANSGVCSRREADELITMGLISVNGTTITELGYKVNPGDVVKYEGKTLTAEKPVYILMNKPKGFLTTTKDPQERNTVMHIIGNAVKERVYPVGRLDRNTTGLLLLTNDGDLAEKLSHPSYNVRKIYRVELDRPLTRKDFERILEGVQLEEGKAMVDDLAIVSDDSKTIGIELHIGWNRVVRRIFESLEYEVVKLDRSVYAGLDKKDLPRGEWRFLRKEEIVHLKHFK